MTTQVNTCGCADSANKTWQGDMTIAKDAAGAGGNLTVEKTLTVGTLVAGNIAVATGSASVETAVIIGDGTTKVFEVSHSAGTRSVIVAVYDSAGKQIGVDTAVTADDKITLSFGNAPLYGVQFTVVILAYQAPVDTPAEEAEDEGGEA